MTTYYVSIGNSDNKLKQQSWALFCHSLTDFVQRNSTNIYGVWHSLPNDSYQNMCIGFETKQDKSLITKVLEAMAEDFDQDTIALAEVSSTYFVGNSNDVRATL